MKFVLLTSLNIIGYQRSKSFSEITKPIREGADYVVDLHRENV